MHAPDLAPMRASLADSLIAWSGGPRGWFQKRTGACIMSAHAKFAIDAARSEQWVDAMRHSVHDYLDPPMARSMIEALEHSARATISKTGGGPKNQHA